MRTIRTGQRKTSANLCILTNSTSARMRLPICSLFAVHVSSLCPQARANGQRLSRNHIPVLRSSSISREGRTIREWQRCRHCTGCGQMPCTFRFSTAVAKLPRQPPPDHLNKRIVFELPWGERGGEPILVSILCLAVCFHHSIILSTAQTRRDRTLVRGLYWNVRFLLVRKVEGFHYEEECWGILRSRSLAYFVRELYPSRW